MIDRRSKAFLLFALFLAVGQTAWVRLATPGGDGVAVGPKTGEPFVYLLPPAQPSKLECAEAGEAPCARRQPPREILRQTQAAPVPGRKPDTLLANRGAATPAPVATKTRTPVPLLPAHAFKDPESDGYLVLGSYASRENAELAVKDFRDWEPIIVPARSDGSELGRVVIGPFRPALMRQVIARLDSQGVEGVWPAKGSELGLAESTAGGVFR